MIKGLLLVCILALAMSKQVEHGDIISYSHDSVVPGWGGAPGAGSNNAGAGWRPNGPQGGMSNTWGPNNAQNNPLNNQNMNDFMMRLSGSGLNCPGIRVSVNRGMGRQQYKYEGPISLTCNVRGRVVNQARCSSYR
jgi:hypothetical protein